MNIESLWAEIEEEQAWRERELRFLQNQVELLEEQAEQDLLRRALVVMLYAHFEGFCRFMFSLYVRVVNEARITCREATYAITAAALSDLFAILRNPSRKSPEFRHALPHDEKLHRFARDREFVERAREFDERIVEIPDTVVDLEQNLKPVVIRKALYQLGLPHDQFEDLDDQIHLLLGYRNSISHGSFRNGLEEAQYAALHKSVLGVMNTVKHGIMTAIERKKYLRAS